MPGVPQNGRKSFPGDVARFEFEPEGDVIDKFVLKKERFQKPYCLDKQFYVRKTYLIKMTC